MTMEERNWSDVRKGPQPRTQSRSKKIMEADSSQSLQKEAATPTILNPKKLISHFWPPELGENKYVVLSHPVCGNLFQQP